MEDICKGVNSTNIQGSSFVGPIRTYTTLVNWQVINIIVNNGRTIDVSIIESMPLEGFKNYEVWFLCLKHILEQYKL